MTQAVLSNGTQIGLGDTLSSPSTWNAILEVTSLGGIGTSIETVEVSSLDSTAKEYISGLQDGVSFSIEFNWIAGNTYQQQLRTDAAAGDAKQFLVVWADSPATKVQFTATPEGFELGAESGSQITASVTLKISGALDWTTTEVIT